MNSRWIAPLLAALAAATALAGAPEKQAQTGAPIRHKLKPRIWQVEQSSTLPGVNHARIWTLGEQGTQLELKDAGAKMRKIPVEAPQAQWLRDKVSALSIPRKGEKPAPALGSACPNRIALRSDLGSRAFCFEQNLKNKDLAELMRTLREVSPPEPTPHP